jgi:hypothetical protein
MKGNNISSLERLRIISGRTYYESIALCTDIKVSVLNIVGFVRFQRTIVAVTKLHASRSQKNHTMLQHEQRSTGE